MALRYSYRKEAAIRELLPDHSYSDIARIVGLSASTVQRIVKSWGYQRTVEDSKTVRSKSRNKLIRMERTRVLYGMHQKTSVKVFANKALSILRYCLKRKGYIVRRNDNVVYYDRDCRRSEKYEADGLKLGLEFVEYPVS